MVNITESADKGLELVQRLRSGGVLAVEIGETQGDEVAELFKAAGMRDVQIHKDLGNLDRAGSGIK